MNYSAYLRSPHWQEVRRRYWASKLPKCCVVCRRNDVPLDLHHRTYKRIGKERLTDLVPLCRRCHKETHLVVDDRKERKRNPRLWSAHRAVAKKKKKKPVVVAGKRKNGTNPRAVGDNPRARKENPRARKKGTA